MYHVIPGWCNLRDLRIEQKNCNANRGSIYSASTHIAKFYSTLSESKSNLHGVHSYLGQLPLVATIIERRKLQTKVLLG